eukprot:PhM_4_TR7470/c0_g1_i1/m.64324/K10590/TRIP12; E3 ubiquitin-protein ligase TRIP12
MSGDPVESRLQALMRMQMFGGDFGARSAGREKISNLIASIASEADDTVMMVNLSELCSTLSMGGEEMVPPSKMEVLVGTLLSQLHRDDNVELMLLACRALTYLMDASQNATRFVVQNGGITILCEKLLNVEFIDLAEQALMAIEQISNDHPQRVLAEGGVTAMLSFIDFFNMSVQRKVVAAVAGLCKRVNSSNFDTVASNLPQLSNFLSYDDPKIIESALLAIHRCLLGAQDDDTKLQVAASEAILNSVMAVLQRQPPVNAACMSVGLRILHAAVASGVRPTEVLLSNGVTDFVSEALGADVLRRDFSLSPLLESARTATDSFSREPSSTIPIIEPLPPPDATPPSQPQRSPNLAASSSRKDLTTEQTTVLISLVNEALPILPPDALPPKGTDTTTAATATTASHTDEDDYEDDDDDEYAIPAQTREGLSRILNSGMMPVDNNSLLHGQRANRTHSCDGCGKSRLDTSDWLRCNNCPDFDLCLHCFISKSREHIQEHAGAGPSHTFSDMNTVLGGAADDTQSHAPSKRALALSEARSVFYQANPAYLQRIVFLFSDILRTYSQSVHVNQRRNCLECLSRMLHMADTDTLKIALESVPFSSFLASQVRSRDPVFLPYAFFMIRTAYEKLPDIFTVFYQREGVVFELQEFVTAMGKAENQSPQNASLRSAATAFLHENYGSSATSGPSGGVTRLKPITSAMERGDVGEALGHLCDLLDTPLGISTHELGHSGFVQQLDAYLCAQGDVEPAMRALRIMSVLAQPMKARQLGREDDVPQTYFSKFVALLHGALNYFDNFVAYVHEDPSGLNSGTASTGAKMLVRPFKLSIRFDEEHSAGQTQIPATRFSELVSLVGDKVSVMIEPLATVGAIEDFIAQRLIMRKSGGLGSASGPTASQPDSDEEQSAELPSPSTPDTLQGSQARKQPSTPEAQTPTRQRPSSETPTKKKTPGSAAAKSGKSDKDKDGVSVSIRIGQHSLPPSMTIFQAVQHLGPWREKVARSDGHEVITSHRMWDEAQVIHFSLKPYEAPEYPQLPTIATNKKGPLVVSLPVTGNLAQSTSTGAVAVNHVASVPLIVSREQYKVNSMALGTLRVMRVLHSTHKNWESLATLVRRYRGLSMSLPGIPDASSLLSVELEPFCSDVYVNPKLTNKILKLLSDPLLLCSGCLASSWCNSLVVDCPFLFPLNVRRSFFEMACLGPTRALLRLQERLSDEGDANQLRIGRVHKQKVRLSRDNVLEAAKKLVDAYGQTRCFVEIEYYDEVGTGLGPTMEFYTLIGRALRKRDQKLWVTDDAEDAEDVYVRAPGGLYPNPATPSTANVAMFRFVGSMVARALFDRRILDLPFSIPVLRVLRDDPVCIDDLAYVAPEVHKTLTKIVWQELGCDVDSLGLDFTLPGHPDIVLCDDGAEVTVTKENVAEYVHLVTTFWLHTSVAMQLCALREQINQLVPLESLRMFYPEELEEVLCGNMDVPTLEALEASVTCDHGYTKASRAIRFLFNILSGYSPADWATFVKFITGAARLPAGGLRSLRPPLTVVRKTQDADEDDVLPSVMTCQNYLKLPDYSSEEKMRDKIRTAMQEGGDTFHLS